ncbi:DUF3159 domain-containing protein [Mycobacterium sp. SP-6446]|uniref:DUF3159 domain-containing protein n=1 Tax=Mycobacterium sp. SP-6446 TaxID=1834162 RepID=UPI00096D1BFF|nr:DUF3159 domain-containing protein [Mycobacterium sp. SP-6446]OMC13905.1 hypothetical protein A5736_21720 [Mycobacterium sp. SP-6446]
MPGETGNRTTLERLLAQAGGVSGVIYSSLPVVTFVTASSLFGLLPAIGSALGVATLVLLWRLIRRESPNPAFSGFFGVAFCALVAYLMGESKGYFLLGIWGSLFWAVVFAVSILIRRPVVGYLWTWASGRDHGWRGVARAVYAFDIATLGWMLVFAARYVVQQQLYDAGRTGWLGVARIGMGWPLTILAGLLTYAAVKAAQRAISAAGKAGDPAASVEADTGLD